MARVSSSLAKLEHHAAKESRLSSVRFLHRPMMVLELLLNFFCPRNKHLHIEGK